MWSRVVSTSQLEFRNMNFLNNTFALYDASPTHLQVLYRSFPTHPSRENLDVLIQGAVYLQVPTTIKGMSIFVKGKNDLERFGSNLGLALEPGKKLFVIMEQEKEYYIVAEKISYQRNQLSGTSLPIKLESSDDVDRLIKMAQSTLEVDWKSFSQIEENPWIEISG